jgi:hypothetical protein
MRAVVLPLLAATLLFFGCDDRRSATTTDDSARHRDAFARFTERMQKIRADSARHGEETRCPDEAIRARLDGRRPVLAIASYEAMAPFSDPSASPFAGDAASYEKLTSATFRAIHPPTPTAADNAVVDALFKAQTLEKEHSHLGVLRAAKLEPPKLEGDRFSAGHFSGWLAIYDLGSGKRECVADVEADSSGELVGTTRQARDRVMWKDFVSNIREAVHSGVKRVSESLVVDLE